MPHTAKIQLTSSGGGSTYHKQYYRKRQRIGIMSRPRCWVYGCESYNIKGKISTFSAPKDPEIRAVWNDILKHPSKKLEETDFICQQHFDPNDIVRFLQVNEVKLPNKKISLIKGRLPIPMVKQEILGSSDADVPPESLSQPAYENITIKCEIDDESSFISEAPVSAEVKTENIEIKEEYDDFFNELFESKLIFGLVEYWGIHSCEPEIPPFKPCMVLIQNNEPKRSRTVLFSQVNTRDGFPIFGKQVIINEKLEIKYLVGQNEVFADLPKICSSLDELCTAINLYSKFKLCPGGPDLCDTYKDIIHVTKSAFVDHSCRKWRHKFCTYFIDDGLPECLHCQLLPKYFKLNLKRSKTLIKLMNDGSDEGASSGIDVLMPKKRGRPRNVRSVEDN